eukprot:scaffold91117_cov63-Phaeocystis_antarctica.AAC.3
MHARSSLVLHPLVGDGFATSVLALRRDASRGASTQAECAWAAVSGPTVHELKGRAQALRTLPRRGHPRCGRLEDADRQGAVLTRMYRPPA